MLIHTRTYVAGLLAGLAIAAVILGGGLEAIELQMYNNLFEWRGLRAPQTPIVIVAIGEDSFDEFNIPWPFPRALHGELIDKLSAARPAAIGLDIVFPEPSPFGPEDDTALAAAVTRARNVVLAAATTSTATPVGLKVTANLPIPEIRRGAAAYGPVNLHLDPDGHIRRGVIMHRITSRDDVMLAFDAHLHRLASARGIPARPLSDRWSVLINYRGGPGTYRWIPYYQVIRGEVPLDTLRGAIVLVGATSPILQDVFSTPFAGARSMPGVEIHANLLETLLQATAIREVPRWVCALVAFGAAMAGAAFVARLRALRAALAVAVVLLPFVVWAFLAFVISDIWFRAVGVSLALVFGYGLPATDAYIREQREKRRLSQFFSPAVLREIVRDNSKLGSSRRTLTVLFSDIRGFTSISERCEPEEVAAMLEDYLSEMTQVVFKHNGTVDKYIGDCVMALYNVPFEDPAHALKAVRTALEFQEITRDVSAKWEARLGVQVMNGVGIHTGEAVVGTLGSRQRREYTAIGDTVNLASRLETATKDQGTSIIISESTYEQVKGQFLCRELGALTVKGKTRPVRIYAVLAADERRYPRVALDVQAEVSGLASDRTATVRMRDLSAAGATLVGLPDDWVVGSTVRIICEGGWLPTPLDASGPIVWRRDPLAGVAFAALTSDAIVAAAEREPAATPV